MGYLVHEGFSVWTTDGQRIILQPSGSYLTIVDGDSDQRIVLPLDDIDLIVEAMTALQSEQGPDPKHDLGEF
jgi:hypothetical protein